MIAHYKDETIKKSSHIKISVLLMVFCLLVTLLTGIFTLYYKSLDAESSLYTTFVMIHRLSGFAGLCFIVYHMPAVAPWFLSKTNSRLDNKGKLILIMSLLLLILMATIILFGSETEIKKWIFIHGNAGLGFFISVVFYIMLYNNK